jgi:hypothetical protein
MSLNLFNQRKFQFMGLALSATLSLFAQSPDLAPAGGRPANALISLKLEAATTGHVPLKVGGFSVVQARADLSLPLPPIGAGTYLIAGLNYQQHALTLDSSTPLPTQLQSLKASLTLIRIINPAWTFIGSVSPGLHNAGTRFTSRGFGVGTLAVANRKFSNDFSAGFGAVYNSLSREHGRALPVASFEWQASPEWKIFVGFPRSGASWQMTDDLAVEFIAEADFGTYYVTTDPQPSLAKKPALNRTRLDYQAFRLGAAAAWRFSPHTSLRATLGAVPMLKADYHQRNYELKSERAAPFFSLALEQKF